MRRKTMINEVSQKSSDWTTTDRLLALVLGSLSLQVAARCRTTI
ncbi:hypothetical protein [Streptococcus pseudopneumoniae]|nr:hypothetical protein [Streptococcus pseudopneumoniae]